MHHPLQVWRRLFYAARDFGTYSYVDAYVRRSRQEDPVYVYAPLGLPLRLETLTAGHLRAALLAAARNEAALIVAIRFSTERVGALLDDVAALERDFQKTYLPSDFFWKVEGGSCLLYVSLWSHFEHCACTEAARAAAS